MCLIAVIPSKADTEGVAKALRLLGKSWDTNSDGAGFAFVKNGRVQIRKPFYSKSQFLRAIRRALYREALGKSDLVAHLRYATHGGLGRDNVHPHIIGSDRRVILAHNGILPGYGDDNSKKGGSGKSDTVEFCEQFFSDVTSTEILGKVGVDALYQAAGNWNKFALLGPDGFARIVNERAGHWRSGVWYSAWVWDGAETETYVSKYGGSFDDGIGCGFKPVVVARTPPQKSGAALLSYLSPSERGILLGTKEQTVAEAILAMAIGRSEIANRATKPVPRVPETVDLNVALGESAATENTAEPEPSAVREEIEAAEREREEAAAEDSPIDYSGVPLAEQEVAPAAPTIGPRKLLQIGAKSGEGSDR